MCALAATRLASSTTEQAAAGTQSVSQSVGGGTRNMFGPPRRRLLRLDVGRRDGDVGGGGGVGEDDWEKRSLSR